MAAFDQVPWELHDNSIILGCLSFFVALIMLYDLSDPMARLVTDMTQTEHDIHNTPQAIQSSTASHSHNHVNTTNQLDSNHSQNASVAKVIYSIRFHSIIIVNVLHILMNRENSNEKYCFFFFLFFVA